MQNYQNGGGNTDSQLMQIIQMFAQLQGVDPKEIMQQLQQLPPDQQQKAVQQMVQTVQQAQQQQEQGAQQQGPEEEQMEGPQGQNPQEEMAEGPAMQMYGGNSYAKGGSWNGTFSGNQGFANGGMSSYNYSDPYSTMMNQGYIPRAQYGMEAPQETWDDSSASNTSDDYSAPGDEYINSPASGAPMAYNFDQPVVSRVAPIASVSQPAPSTSDLYSGYSIVDFLNKNHLKSDRSTRNIIAQILNINDYRGLKDQNTFMLHTLMGNPHLMEKLLPAIVGNKTKDNNKTREVIKAMAHNSAVNNVTPVGGPSPASSPASDSNRVNINPPDTTFNLPVNTPKNKKDSVGTYRKTKGYTPTVKATSDMNSALLGTIYGVAGLAGAASVGNDIATILKRNKLLTAAKLNNSKAMANMTEGAGKEMINETKKVSDWYDKLSPKEKKIIKNLDAMEISGLHQGSGAHHLNAVNANREANLEQILWNAHQTKIALAEAEQEAQIAQHIKGLVKSGEIHPTEVPSMMDKFMGTLKSIKGTVGSVKNSKVGKAAGEAAEFIGKSKLGKWAGEFMGGMREEGGAVTKFELGGGYIPSYEMAYGGGPCFDAHGNPIPCPQQDSQSFNPYNQRMEQSKWFGTQRPDYGNYMKPKQPYTQSPSRQEIPKSYQPYTQQQTDSTIHSWQQKNGGNIYDNGGVVEVHPDDLQATIQKLQEGGYQFEIMH